MTRSTQKSRAAEFADGAVTPGNALPIDEALRISVRPGIAARYGLCPLELLQDNPHAIRTHSGRQLKKLARSMAVSGPLSPIIVDEHLVILAGHARVKAHRLLGDGQAPILQVFGLSEAMKRQHLLADNRVGADAGLDRRKLFAQLPELTAILADEGFTLEDTGLEIAEIDALTADLGDDSIDPSDGFDAALLDGDPVLRLGDLVQLGEHRLLVGDARDAKALDRLMNGEVAAAAFLDIPYNVRARNIGGRGRIKHEDFAQASGELSRPEFRQFIRSAASNAARVSAPSALHYICIDRLHVHDLIEAGELVYDAYLDLIVWNKTNGGQGGLYRSQHELIGLFRVGPECALDNVQKGKFGRNRTNVWVYPGVNVFRAGRMDDLAAHPTVKPVRLVADAFKDCTRPNDIVLDTFVGSGTTILAAEQIGRRARAMEIEPKYADVAVRRWQALTGRDAVHVETGLPFSALNASVRPPVPRVRVRLRLP